MNPNRPKKPVPDWIKKTRAKPKVSAKARKVYKIDTPKALQMMAIRDFYKTGYWEMVTDRRALIDGGKCVGCERREGLRCRLLTMRHHGNQFDHLETCRTFCEFCAHDWDTVAP